MAIAVLAVQRARGSGDEASCAPTSKNASQSSSVMHVVMRPSVRQSASSRSSSRQRPDASLVQTDGLGDVSVGVVRLVAAQEELTGPDQLVVE